MDPHLDENRESKVSKRIKAELAEFKFCHHNGITAAPASEDNVFEWNIHISPPKGTAYEGSVLPGTLTFPKEYPLLPPKVQFAGQVFHPNVALDGSVGLPMLFVAGSDPAHQDSKSERWSPVQSAEKVLLAVRGMFVHPIEESVVNSQAEQLWRTDKTKFEETVKRAIQMTAAL